MRQNPREKLLFSGRKTRLRRTTYGDQIYAELCRTLTSGELAPGDRLSIRKIAARLGVSMMPVREAVTRLAVDGALEILPTKAIRVPIMTRAIFEELTTVRIEIEGYAAEQAAMRRSKEELTLIKQYDEAFRDAVFGDYPDNQDALKANRNLHFTIYRASGFPTLVRITEMLWLRVGPIIYVDLETSGGWRARSAVDHHRHIVQAIENRDGSGARKALVGDLLGTADFVMKSGHLADSKSTSSMTNA
jgi:DNA-binding GntR family transcriptional regulator